MPILPKLDILTVNFIFDVRTVEPVDTFCYFLFIACLQLKIRFAVSVKNLQIYDLVSSITTASLDYDGLNKHLSLQWVVFGEFR